MHARHQSAPSFIRAAICIAAAASPATAQTIAYDPFDGATGAPVSNQSGGTGWSGPWQDYYATSVSVIGSGSLHAGSLATLGNRGAMAAMGDYQYRPLGQNLGQTEATVFASFLIRPVAGVAGFNAWGGIAFGTTTGASLFVGKGGQNPQYALETWGGAGIALSQTVAVEGETALLVFRVRFASGAESVDLWVNPPPGPNPPAQPNASKSDLDTGVVTGIWISSGDGLAFDLDEIRLGGSYASVTPQVCYPNCDASTQPPVLNANDFLCFLNRFAAQDPYANCDGSTTSPALNALDFSCFLTAFAAACP
jgi:hypothetical protein